MNRLKTPNYYIEAAKQEWNMDKDICTYNKSQRLLEGSVYISKEIFKEVTGQNLDTKNAFEVTKFSADKFRDTMTTGHKTLLKKEQYNLMMKEMVKKHPWFGKSMKRWNLVSLLMEAKTIAQIVFLNNLRNQTIKDICKPVIPKEVNDNLKLLLEKMKKDPGVKFDKVAPPRRLKTPDIDNNHGRTMIG